MEHHSEVSTASLWRGRSAGPAAADGGVIVSGTAVRGLLVDGETRCEHYSGPLDVIALQFACCREWYPCHLCHQEVADHDARQWSKDARSTEAVLCGVCGAMLTIADYLEASACPTCTAGFNPGCRLHHRLYFD